MHVAWRAVTSQAKDPCLLSAAHPVAAEVKDLLGTSWKLHKYLVTLESVKTEGMRGYLRMRREDGVMES